MIRITDEMGAAQFCVQERLTVMENCLSQGKAICTFDLKDESGLYYEDMVLEWKQAAANRWLTCMECGAPVYLAAGPIKEPYFAHYDLNDCDYGNGHESEELKKGKRLLYKLLKRSFPESTVQARYRMENGMYSTLYCRVEDGNQIAVDYRLQNNSLEKFRLRDSHYQAINITPLYVMGIRQEKDTKQIDWYQSLLQTSMGYLAFLNVEQDSLTLKKSFGYRIGKERKFLYCSKSYPICDLLLDSEGQLDCDFVMECNKIEIQIKEEKLCYKITQENRLKLIEEKLRLEAAENEKWEAYHRERKLKELESSKLIDLNVEDSKRKQQDEYRSSKLREQSSEITDLNPVLLEKCKRMIEEGSAHLVSRKYYDAIMRIT